MCRRLCVILTYGIKWAACVRGDGDKAVMLFDEHALEGALRATVAHQARARLTMFGLVKFEFCYRQLRAPHAPRCGAPEQTHRMMVPGIPCPT